MARRHGVPVYPGIGPSLAVDSGAMTSLVRKLAADDGSLCLGCGERTETVSAVYCEPCSLVRSRQARSKAHVGRPRTPTQLKAAKSRVETERRVREAVIEASALWTRSRAAEFLLVSPGAVAYHERAGRITPTQRLPRSLGNGHGLPLYDPIDVKRLALALLPELRKVDVLELPRVIAKRVPTRIAVYGRIRVDGPGRPRRDEVRELLLAAAHQSIYTWTKMGDVDGLTQGQLEWEAANALWLDQRARNEYDWLPKSWASPTDPKELSRFYGANVKARVRGLIGPQLREVLQIARKQLGAD